MTKIANNLTELIGHTPLMKLAAYCAETGLATPIVAKLEYFNPAGSVKDRVAYNMVLDAERRGILRPGATIIEPTSGNTGVGLAFVSAVRGYNLILTMPETMSAERRNLVKAYGARVELTPGKDGMQGSIDRANQLRDRIEGAVILQQFENPANPEAHYLTTAEEIWADTDGHVDILVAGAGTGGTISGTGRRLRELNPDIRIVAAEPASSPVLSGGKAGPHKIQGIGANFIPRTYDPSVVDEVVTIENDDAILTSRRLAATEGLLVGISSGCSVAAARILASRPENAGKTIIAILPDTGERYLSTELYDFDGYPL